MLNEIIVVVVGAFAKAGSIADKNGIANVFLTPVCGKIPNKAMVVAGTVAEKAGLHIGSTLLVMVTEKEPDETYGRQFGHTVLGAVAPTEILGLRKELGAALVLDVTNGSEAGEDAGEEGNTPNLNTAGLGNGANANAGNAGAGGNKAAGQDTGGKKKP